MTEPTADVLTNQILDERLEQLSIAPTDIGANADCESESITSAITEPPISSVAALSVAAPSGCRQ
jgi:hypothetical protein